MVGGGRLAADFLRHALRSADRAARDFAARLLEDDFDDESQLAITRSTRELDDFKEPPPQLSPGALGVPAGEPANIAFVPVTGNRTHG